MNYIRSHCIFWGVTACLTDLPVLEPLGEGAGGLHGPGHARLLHPVREVEQAAVAVERVPVQLKRRTGRRGSNHQIFNSPNCDQKSCRDLPCYESTVGQSQEERRKRSSAEKKFSSSVAAAIRREIRGKSKMREGGCSGSVQVSFFSR